MSLQIYTISGSPYGWRAMLALAAKGLDHEIKILQAGKKEQKSDWYLKLNPKGTVPLLVDDGFAVRDSAAIVAYLDAKYPQPALFGASPEDAGVIWQTANELESEFWPVLSSVTRPILRGKSHEDRDAALSDVETVMDKFQSLDDGLGSGTYLMGDRISAADIYLMPMTQVWLRAVVRDAGVESPLGLKSFEDPCPNLASWVGRMEALPGYDNTYPDHWR